MANEDRESFVRISKLGRNAEIYSRTFFEVSYSRAHGLTCGDKLSRDLVTLDGFLRREAVRVKG